jgi:hypothetical protein
MIYREAMLLRIAILVLVVGCRGPIAAHIDGSTSDTGDAAVTDGPGGDGGGNLDGTPMRRPCTSTFGSALSPEFGRMDGYLVAIVLPGSSSGPCNSDLGHVHLQVQVTGAVYDVAVNIGTNDATNDVHSTTLDHALIGPAWSEGWHPRATVATVAIDYAALGVHSNTLPLRTEAENVSALMTELATANHVSIYATGYSPTPSGAHLVHRSTSGRSGEDGMVVTQPLSPTAHARLFSFTGQVF